jgi:signal transduction histidine kinase
VSVAPVAVSLAGRCALEDRPVVHFRATEGSDVREVWLAVRVPDWRGGFGGFAAGRLDVPGRRFADAAAPLLQTGLGSIVLADPRGLVIATSRPAPAIQDVADVMGIAEARMATTGWRVVLLEDPAGAGRPLLLEWLVLSVLLAGLALLFAWGAGQSVRRPLEALTATAERIADGDLSQPVPSIPADEVGRLARAFERMRVALRDSLARIAADNVELEQRVDERTRELARVNQELRDREQARLQLLRKVIRAQEDERKRIARELHDDTCQALTALTMRLEVAQAAVSGQPVETAVSETRALARHSLEGVHRLMHDLRPSVLDDLGLVAALRWLADHRLAPDGISVRFEIGDVPERLAPELETALFRAAQEALINVQRHANAERVLVQIGERDGRFCIEIEDDGEGFSAGELAPRPGDARGLGLLGMRERVELFDGSVTIESSPGNGTRVLIEVPMGPSPADHHAEDPGPDR